MKRKQLAVLMTMILLVTLFPHAVYAEEHENQVHVIVENRTYEKTSGAPWEGRVIDTWVTIDESSTGVSVLTEAVGGSGNLDAPSSAYGTYINAILGITAGDGGSDEALGYNPAGWLYMINDTVPAFGIDQCSVAAGTLSSGDELAFCYSLNGGTDIGYDWSSNAQKALKDLTISSGLLAPEFTSGTTVYSLTISSDTNSVVLSPEAENKNETVTISADGTEYKRAMEIPVDTGTQITIQCKNGDGTEETVYTIYVKRASGISAETMLSATKSLLSVDEGQNTALYGNEWLVMSMARAGILSEERTAQYYASIEAALKETGSNRLDSRYATTNARVILALSAAGISADNVGGYDLLEPLSDMDYITGQGVNAAMYALLAFDSNDYSISRAAEGVNQTTRDGLIQYILDAQLSEGGWDWSGMRADPDLTANAIQALAPYYEDNAAVKEAVDRALQALSDIQNPDGSYSSWGTQNACSTAQVLTAITILGLDPRTDSRFVKNGYTLIDALGDFYLSGGGFHYDLSSRDMDAAFSTVQAFYALISYDRMSQNQNTLFDMTDAFPEVPEATTGTQTETPTETTTEAAAGASSSEGATVRQSSPATGDTMPVFLLCGVAITAILGAGMFGYRYKKTGC